MKTIRILTVLSTLCVAIFISCSDDATGPGVAFEPGTNFIGTYQTQQDPLSDPKVDTMYFEFQSDGDFFMRRLSSSYLAGVDSIDLNDSIITDGIIMINGLNVVDNDQVHCDIRNVPYNFITHTDSIVINVPDNYTFLETCVHEEAPDDRFRYAGQGNDIILVGDDDTYARRIILWAEIAIKIYN